MLFSCVGPHISIMEWRQLDRVCQEVHIITSRLCTCGRACPNPVVEVLFAEGDRTATGSIWHQLPSKYKMTRVEFETWHMAACPQTIRCFSCTWSRHAPSRPTGTKTATSLPTQRQEIRAVWKQEKAPEWCLVYVVQSSSIYPPYIQSLA